MGLNFEAAKGKSRFPSHALSFSGTDVPVGQWVAVTVRNTSP
jgi:hypothetical protein